MEVAKDYLEQALTLFRDLGDAERAAWTLYNLGMLAVQTGDLDAAARTLQESLSLRLEHGSEAQVSQTFAGLSRAALRHGKPERAARLLGVADAIRTANGIAMPADEDGEAELRCREQVGTTLGAKGFDAALAAGRQLTQAEAVRSHRPSWRAACRVEVRAS